MVYSEGDVLRTGFDSPRRAHRRRRARAAGAARAPTAKTGNSFAFPARSARSFYKLPKRKRAETPSFPIDERFTRCELHALARLRLGGGRLFLDLLYGFH